MVSVASKRGGGGGGKGDHHHHHHQHLLLDELDHDRKVRKRRARLVAAAEEAFTHIRRIRRDGQGSAGE